MRDGLPVNTISQMTQSRDGYLWLATFDGLVRFDGARFQVYSGSNTPGLGHQRLVSVIESDSGLLLLSSDSGVLQLFDPRSATARVLWTTPTDKPPLVWVGPDGEIWISLDPGLGRLRSNRIEPLAQAPLAHWRVTGLGFGSGGQLWVASDTGVWSWTAGAVRQLAAPDQLTVGRIRALAKDSDGTLWVGGDQGIELIAASGVRALYDGDQAWRVATQYLERKRDGSILIGSEIGPVKLHEGRLLAFDPADRRRAPIQTQVLAIDPDWLVSASAVFRTALATRQDNAPAREPLYRLDDLEATRITYALRDRGGSFWFATSGAGLHRLRPTTFSVLSEAQGLSAREVYPLHQSADGAIWIGTQKGSLNRYQDGRVENFGAATGLLDDNIRALASDREGALWVATEEAGLFQQQADGQFHAQRSAPAPGARVKALFLDRDGVLWSGADSGLYRRDATGIWLRHGASDALPGCTIRVIRQAKDGALWIGSHRCGLARLAEDSISRYSADHGDIGNHVRDIYFADEGSVLIATEDRGVGRLKLSEPGAVEPRLVSLRATHGLLSDGIHQILADGHGWLWMSTNRGIFRVRQSELLTAADQLATGRVPERLAIDSYAEAAGLRNREANGGVHSTALVTQAGDLWFATQDGVAMVDPDPTRLVRPVQPFIEGVSSGEHRWRAGQPLTLAANSRSFHIEYTELLQMDAEQSRFRYRLLGYDEGWIDAGSARSASYTKVPPGDYEFQVQAWSGGAWSGGANQLLTLQPYFSETPAFRVILVLIAMALLWLVYRVRVSWLHAQRRELRRQVDVRTEQLTAGKEAAEQASQLIAAQAEKLREVDRQKSRFFDDLAHELRTPLTLILGPLKDVQRATDSTPQAAIAGAIRNSEVLLDLTNQLLDLARLEAGKLRLDRRPEDLVAMLRASAERFQPLAVSRGIGFRCTAPQRPLMAQIDLRHAPKIIDNLLSNAFKFTPSGGQVELVLSVEAMCQARIEVSDNGSGISPEHLPHVFERFYQSGDAGSRLQPGTGIGLALVHDLTELHDGRLEVHSAQGSGTTFSVLLPLCEPPAAGAAVVEEFASVAAALSRANASDDPISTDDTADQTTVLVVDDHAEIRSHVRRHLAPRYRVIEAADGLEALALARERLPDLIVADISMPLLDGYGLCAQVRCDAELEWLPIILLTARGGIDDRLKGLRAAADDYLTKPFDADELRARVDNLIALRLRLRDRYLQQVSGAAPSIASPVTRSVADSQQDSDATYLAHLLAVIRTRMVDEAFKVADLAIAMEQDRSHLFRRVREVAGLAPSDLIRGLRLERAAELLLADAGSVSDIAYAVGFSSVAYFTKCFRERYGRTPGQYRVRPIGG